MIGLRSGTDGQGGDGAGVGWGGCTGQKGQQSLITDRRGIAGRTAGLWRFGDRDGLGRGGGKGRVRHGWRGDKSSWGLLVGWEGQVSGTSGALNYVFSLNFRGGASLLKPQEQLESSRVLRVLGTLHERIQILSRWRFRYQPQKSGERDP